MDMEQRQGNVRWSNRGMTSDTRRHLLLGQALATNVRIVYTNSGTKQGLLCFPFQWIQAELLLLTFRSTFPTPLQSLSLSTIMINVDFSLPNSHRRRAAFPHMDSPAILLYFTESLTLQQNYISILYTSAAPSSHHHLNDLDNTYRGTSHSEPEWLECSPNVGRPASTLHLLCSNILPHRAVVVRDEWAKSNQGEPIFP